MILKLFSFQIKKILLYCEEDSTGRIVGLEKRIVFATGNKDKMKEIRQILVELEQMGWELLSMKEAGLFAEIEENGRTFEENAIIKAKAVAELAAKSGMEAVVLADDSGLEVDYMDRQPGVLSARFLGESTSYSVKNKYILDRLAEAEGAERSARFVCVIAAVLPDGEVVTEKACVEGQIAYQEEGEGGFGYDPIFYLPEYKTTTAGLSPKEKNKISHRGKALRQMREKLKQRYEEGRA